MCCPWSTSRRRHHQQVRMGYRVDSWAAHQGKLLRRAFRGLLYYRRLCRPCTQRWPLDLGRIAVGDLRRLLRSHRLLALRLLLRCNAWGSPRGIHKLSMLNAAGGHRRRPLRGLRWRQVSGLF